MNLNTSLISLLFCSLISYSGFATFITVSNQTNMDVDFYTIQDAINAAIAGDSIYIHGSPNAYTGSFQVDKMLHFLGPGYQLEENGLYTNNSDPAKIQSAFNFNSGSEGSIVEGLTFSSTIYIRENSIEIRKNHFHPGTIFLSVTIDSCWIYNNFFDQVAPGTGVFTKINSATSSISLTNIFIVNNIIYGDIDIRNPDDGNSNILLLNNTFPRFNATPPNNGSSYRIDLRGIYARNNLFMSLVSNNYPGETTFEQNIFATAFPSGVSSSNGNVENIDLTQVYTVVEDQNDDGLLDANFMNMVAGVNPATDNCDQGCGASFGPNPIYRISGIPELPYIYELTSDNVSNESGNINITVKARSY